MKIMVFIIFIAFFCNSIKSYSQRGTISVESGWYPAGTNMVIEAIPHLYSQFDSWSGNVNSSSNQIGILVDKPLSLFANFSPIRTEIGSVPYEWLANWTNDNFETVVLEDWDSDGFSNICEFWSATDPTNPELHLKISYMTITNGVISLLWYNQYVHSSINDIKIYHISNLSSGTWSYIGQITPVEGINMWMTNATSNGYYRLISEY